jgi:hypothetical protein
MRRLAILCAVLTLIPLFGVAGFGGAAFASEALAGKIRLAQTSTVTNCMMTCNAQAASCQTSCVLPWSAGGNTAATNSSNSANCQLTCSTQQVSCQTTCGRTSPSP